MENLTQKAIPMLAKFPAMVKKYREITENQDGTEKVHVLKSTENRSKITRGKSDKEETCIKGEKSGK